MVALWENFELGQANTHILFWEIQSPPQCFDTFLQMLPFFYEHYL